MGQRLIVFAVRELCIKSPIMMTRHRESHPAWALLSCIALMMGCSASGLGPRCAEYLGENGCCFKAAAGNPAAVDACQELAARYAGSPSRARDEESCQEAQETAIAARLCGSAAGGQEPSSACARYLTCIAKAAPEALPAARKSYGSASSCWSSASAAATCTTACLEALDRQRRATPSIPECAVCATSTDCWSAQPICDPVSKTCVACTQDVECPKGLCVGEKCMPGCRIDGMYVAPQAANPHNSCQSCQPTKTMAAWSDLPAGTECAAGSVCAGSCQPGCYIDGVFRAPNTIDPSSSCHKCEPTLETGLWSNLADGTGCGGGMFCLGGLCGGIKFAP